MNGVDDATRIDGSTATEKDPDVEEYFFTHVRTHCDTLLRVSWEFSSLKKSESGGRYYATHAQRYLGKICDDEGRASVLQSLQGKEDRNLNRDEIMTKKTSFVKRKG